MRGWINFELGACFRSVWRAVSKFLFTIRWRAIGYAVAAMVFVDMVQTTKNCSGLMHANE